MFELLNTKLHTYGISPALLIGLFVVSLMLSMPLMAQVCDGNLGENIFTDGDFGRGNTNVVSTDPQIAPGYHYEPHPPPNDGSYTITNYTGLWNLFPGWLQIRDNSTDQFGYMMVVNASYEPGLFYEKEILDLCENTLYEFSADIINMLSSGSNMIKPNVSFLLDAVVMYNTGEIPEDEKWNTYGFTFTTAPGQFSVKLSLQNNAPGGMGNDLALDNIAFRPCGPEALILPKELSNICEDGDPILLSATLVGNQFDTPSYQWQQSFDEGGSWQDIPAAIGSQISHTDLSGGYYHYRYLVANGDDNLSNSKCRIVSNVKIVHVHPKAYDLVDTICEGHGYRVGDNVYSTTGEYEDSLIGAIGCDSIVRLTLTVMPYTGMQTEYTYSHPSCSYLEDGTFYVENISSGWPPYHFSFGGEPKNIDQTITNLPGGSYFFSITDHFGCGIEDSVTLISPHPFVVDLGPDFQIAVGALIQIVPSTNY